MCRQGLFRPPPEAPCLPYKSLPLHPVLPPLHQPCPAPHAIVFHSAALPSSAQVPCSSSTNLQKFAEPPALVSDWPRLPRDRCTLRSRPPIGRLLSGRSASCSETAGLKISASRQSMFMAASRQSPNCVNRPRGCLVCVCRVGRTALCERSPTCRFPDGPAVARGNSKILRNYSFHCLYTFSP